MSRRECAAAFVVCALLALPADAQTITTNRAIRGTSATSYALDGLPTPTRAVALQRLLTSYVTNKLVTLRRTSDSATANIGFTATGAIDVAAASTHCSAGADPCFATAVYDQSGAGLDFTQATPGNQPAFIFNCLGTQPCLRMLAASSALSGASASPATGVASYAAVALKSGTTTACFFRHNGNNNRLQIALAGASWQVVGGTSGSVTTPITFGAWGAAAGVLNGASSSLNVNGTNITGTATGNTTAGVASITIGTGTDPCSFMSYVLWDNVVLTDAQASIVVNNSRGWWGF